MASQKQTEKQAAGGGQQQALTPQAQPQIARPVPAVRGIARTSPVSAMRRLLDELDTGMFGWSPASMMRRVLDDMERMLESNVFEDVGWRAERAERAGRESAWAPRIDVRQRGDKLVVVVDLPGVSQDQVEISAQDDALVIEGERVRPSEEGELWQSERSYGRFRRIVALPEGVDPDQAVARFENGVLEISLPLPASQTTRRIQIQAGEQGQEASSAAGPSSAAGQEKQTKQPGAQVERH